MKQMANAWAKAKGANKEKEEPAEKRDMKAHYAELFNRKRERTQAIRMAMVGKENTAKTGSAVDLALQHLKSVGKEDAGVAILILTTAQFKQSPQTILTTTTFSSFLFTMS